MDGSIDKMFATIEPLLTALGTFLNGSVEALGDLSGGA